MTLTGTLNRLAEPFLSVGYRSNHAKPRPKPTPGQTTLGQTREKSEIIYSQIVHAGDPTRDLPIKTTTHTTAQGRSSKKGVVRAVFISSGIPEVFLRINNPIDAIVAFVQNLLARNRVIVMSIEILDHRSKMDDICPRA
ncbi:jg11854 [Pararge aegeria aegeria]|uniref:Jg11854 protein n=1 Tax=Pararge aegeria aegeria TaxID=348720 RepID=A0A8S4SLI1_9NEOP|nr:jg11854 [Pararge aegeria aegeria]